MWAEISLILFVSRILLCQASLNEVRWGKNDFDIRSKNYRNAMNTTSSAVASVPSNYTNNNHFTNALLAKLVLFDEFSVDKDLDDAIKIANYIIDSAGVDTSFGGLFGAPLFTGGYAKYLPEDIKESLAQMLFNSLPDDPTQPWCDVSYTNIYLMHKANLITLGEALNEYGPKASKATQSGYDFFWKWVNYTDYAGLHEFDSPTYTSVQLNGLYIIQMYAKDSETRSAAEMVTDYIWVGTGASWFAAGQMQAGAHSRDYDFLFGKGLLTSQLYLAGYTDSKEDNVYACEEKDVHCEALVCPWNVQMSDAMVLNCIGSGLQAVFGYLAMVASDWKVPEKGFELAHQREKFVEKRWQEGPAGDYYLQISKNFAIGLIADDYDTNLHDPYIPYPPNAQDKVFAIALTSFQLPQSNPLPVFSFAPDWRYSDVYGKHILEAAGKPVKLRVRPTAIMAPGLKSNAKKYKTDQSTTVAVFLLAIDPLMNETAGWEPDVATHLSLNTIIPWLDDFSLHIDQKEVNIPKEDSKDFTIQAGNLPTLGVLGGGAATAIRIFLADSCGEEVQKSYTTLKGEASDTGGLIFNALRMETVLYDSKVGDDVRKVCKNDGLLRVGVLVAISNAPNGSDDLAALENMVAEAKVNVSQDGTITSVSANLDGSTFELARDLSGTSEANEGAIIYRRLNGEDVKPMDGTVLRVNGEEVAKFPTV